MVRYSHARFKARFPRGYRYSRSHYWMAAPEEGGCLWRVGFTKFATRMLGELVAVDYRVADGALVGAGDELGTVEGFKAISDIFSVMDGVFRGGNPALDQDACIVRSAPYLDGWLYAVEGLPEEGSLDCEGYIQLLNDTIERMAAEGYGED
jgi:glycine cleavage system H protein